MKQWMHTILKRLLALWIMLWMLFGTNWHPRAAAYTDRDQIRATVPEHNMENSCLGCHETSYGLAGAETLESGRRTFQRYACFGCHQSRGFERLPKFAPPLEDLDEKIRDRRWLMAWLRAPQAINRQTIMPDFDLSDSEIADIATFLYSLESERVYPHVDLTEASEERGSRLFTESGCKACHSDEREQPSHRRRVPNLADAGLKLNPDWVILELEIPRELNPDSRVPRLEMSRADSYDVIAYLASLKAGTELIAAESTLSASASPVNGKRLIEQYGCYGCHYVAGFEDALFQAPDLSDVAEALSGGAGNSQANEQNLREMIDKVRNPRRHAGMRMPLISVDEEEMEALAIFVLNNFRFSLPPEFMAPANDRQRIGREGESIVTEFNCRACHLLEEATRPRVELFIGLKTYFPPRLIGEGEKVQPDWLAQFLCEPAVLRPWLRMRMPQFFLSDSQVSTLIGYFSHQAARPENAQVPYALPFRREDLAPVQLEMGEYRFRFDRCMQCHPILFQEEKLPPEIGLDDLAINLMLAKSRLRFEWIKNFLKDPDRYAGPDTRMPYIYFSPDATPRVSDADMWIEYVAKYLMVMERIPPPWVEEEAQGTVDWIHAEY